MSKRIITIALSCLTASLLAPDVRAETVVAANYEVQSLLGVTGQMYHHDQEYSHGNGALVCKATASIGAVTMSFPFRVPATQRLNYADITGKRASGAPPLELRVKKSCMHWSEVDPTTTTLVTRVPFISTGGFFNEHIPLADEQPNNYDCRYWVEAKINVSTGAKCTDGDVYIQKITILSRIPDRIFRGSFHTNLPYDTP